MSRTASAVRTETLSEEVYTAAHAFAQSLAESAEFQAYELASERLSQDETAQKAIRAFQNKQQSLQMMLRLNAISLEDRAELERLQKAYMDQPAVMTYLEAQEELNGLCQASAGLLSERIGLSFTAACGPGCC